MNPKLIPAISAVVMVAIGVSYMLFLAYTWQQMKRDRSAGLARVDEILDRLAKPQPVVTPDAG